MQLTLYYFPGAILCFGSRIELYERHISQILSFVYFTGEHAQFEEIIIRVVAYVVHVVGNDIVLCQVGTYIVVPGPKHGVTHGFPAEVAHAVQYRTDRLDDGIAGRRALVEDPFLLDVIRQDLIARHVALFDDIGIPFGCTSRFYFVEDMETFEHVFHFHLVVLGEYFSTIEIFINLYFIRSDKTQQYAEEVFLPVYDFFWVI